MAEKQDKHVPKALYLLGLIPVLMFGLLGAFFGFLNDNSSPASGFLTGLGVGAVILLVCGAGMLISEWIKKEAGKGKLLPYLLVGFLAAIAISGFIAVNLGKPSCDEQGDAPYSSCISYADDGFEATSDQRWDKFWGALPVTAVITSLIAVIVKNGADKNKE